MRRAVHTNARTRARTHTHTHTHTHTAMSILGYSDGYNVYFPLVASSRAMSRRLLRGVYLPTNIQFGRFRVNDLYKFEKEMNE